MKEDIRISLAEGTRLLHIWEVLHGQGRIPYSYSTFRRHVLAALGKKALQASSTEPKLINRDAPAQQAPVISSPASAGPTRVAPMPTFTYDPIPDPKELI